MNLEKSVGSRILAQALDSTALQKNTRLTEWVKLRFFQSTVKPIACTIIPRPTDLSRLKRDKRVSSKSKQPNLASKEGMQGDHYDCSKD